MMTDADGTAAGTGPQGSDERYPAEAVKVWQKYEDVAMHFNDLMMRWRLQAIGGLATVTTLAGAVVTQVSDEANRYWAMLLLSLLLFFGWVGIAVIDLWYYRSLLRGAVQSLVGIERAIPGISLSTDIENEAELAGRVGPFIFYGCALLPLVLIVAYAVLRLCQAGG